MEQCAVAGTQFEARADAAGKGNINAGKVAEGGVGVRIFYDH